ncbi:terminase [Escherichia coli]|nr:terminase [Escherichia coli]EFA5835459.1 terminase [Escherichia coli]EFA8071818.1 terminase [Escherichia coli]EKJ5166157.1 terminase [Escherichia coli]
MSSEFEAMLADDMGRFFYDPLGFVMYAFNWGTGELEGFDGPDEWQKEFLTDWGDAIRTNNFDGVKPVEAYRCATSSGHGIGKSALTAWVILYILSTRPFCKGVVTANTSEQLRTKTWGELGKWKKRCITGHWFEYNNGKGNMNIYHVDHMESWRCDGQTCREENSESFAGLHAANSSPFYIFDEASAVPDKIWEVAEGGLTDGEPFWFAFGNATCNTGRFRECFRKFKHRWRRRQIDSRLAKMTNKELIEEWRKDYGEDSDFFKVRVRGLFPSTSEVQFIPQAYVDEAMSRTLEPGSYTFASKIIGVDPAYTGSDEASIYLRQGLHARLLGTYPKTDDDVKFAQIVAGFEDEHKADAVFIDFGYGTGIHSIGRSWGRKWQLVNFGGESKDPGMLNKRGEMWNSMKSWLKEGGSIDDQQTADEIVAPEYRVKLDGRIVLEAKEDMKRRGVPSPNRADALALTFAFPVVKNKPTKPLPAPIRPISRGR